MEIEGPLFAIVTPFEDNGDICFSALTEYLEFLNSHDVENIVVNGTTGEFASLTLDERMAVLERCRESFKGKIISHVSACAVKDTLQLLGHSRQFADAVLILPPFYYAEVSASGIYTFFEEILSRCEIPAFLYNFPRHAKNRVTPEMLRDLKRRFDCLRGIKDSGGDFSISRQFKSSADDLQVFVGGDRLAIQVLEAGLDGSVTGGGNPLPECLTGIYRSFSHNDEKGARKWQDLLDLWTDFRKTAGLAEIPVVKAGLRSRLKGFPLYSRPPFSAPSREATEEVSSFIVNKVLPRL